VQECADLTYLAFDLADTYRIPVLVLADGMIGQMMEAVTLPPEKSPAELPRRDWTVGRMERRDSRHITSIDLVPENLEAATRSRFARYETIKERETRYEALGTEDADLILVAYGTSARVCQGARTLAAREGIKLGVFRPVTLWPFPYGPLGELARRGLPLLTVEMSLGQLVEDVKLSVLEGAKGGVPAGAGGVYLLGHSGGVIPTEEEVFAEARKILKGR
jgi:2-oxoglutarate ferredoxin oxidoreductase subunit alpha